MVLYTSLLFIVLSALTYAGNTIATALNHKRFDGLSTQARGILTETQAAPRWVAYSDKFTSSSGPPAPSAIDGFNVFALSFLLYTGGTVDNAQVWQELTAAEQSSILDEYHAAGISLVVSCFGSTETPTSAGADPTDTANTIAAWVLQYGVDGVDVDYEDFNAFNGGTAEAWIITFTQQLRSKLPQGSYILTHAPVAPWFSPSMWTNGGYLAIHQSVGSLIDWYNVQFYNQGTSEYTTCAGLLTASSSTWPESAVFQIIANGVDQSKIVIGKPATSSDATNGYMDPNTLATCLQQAQSQGWDGGAMVWQYPDAGSSWIETVRSLSWPV